MVKRRNWFRGLFGSSAARSTRDRWEFETRTQRQRPPRRRTPRVAARAENALAAREGRRGARAAQQTAASDVLQHGVWDDPDVRELQAFLIERGYVGKDDEVLEEDGRFGGNTEFALKAWQADNGLDVTGEISRDQLRSMETDAALARDRTHRIPLPRRRPAEPALPPDALGVETPRAAGMPMPRPSPYRNVESQVPLPRRSPARPDPLEALREEARQFGLRDDANIPAEGSTDGYRPMVQQGQAPQTRRFVSDTGMEAAPPYGQVPTHRPEPRDNGSPYRGNPAPLPQLGGAQIDPGRFAARPAPVQRLPTHPAAMEDTSHGMVPPIDPMQRAGASRVTVPWTSRQGPDAMEGAPRLPTSPHAALGGPNYGRPGPQKGDTVDRREAEDPIADVIRQMIDDGGPNKSWSGLPRREGEAIGVAKTVVPDDDGFFVQGLSDLQGFFGAPRLDRDHDYPQGTGPMKSVTGQKASGPVIRPDGPTRRSGVRLIPVQGDPFQ